MAKAAKKINDQTAGNTLYYTRWPKNRNFSKIH